MKRAPRARPIDAIAVIRGLAARQHGVVERGQLVEAGVPAHVVDYQVKKRRLHCLHRGVYRVGPVPGRYEREMAAVLACGETALLSHGDAAAVWGLWPDGAGGGPVEVSVEGGFRAPGAGVRVHRVSRMPADEWTSREGIPITTPARTLLDLAGSRSVGDRELELAVAQAERQGLVRREELASLLRRHARRAGTRRLRALLNDGPAFTRSQVEAAFLALVRRGRFPSPEVNVRVGGYEVDFLWRAEGLVVEIDGFAFHSSRWAFERDRRRDEVLTAAGLRVMRITWRRLASDPDGVMVSVARALVTTPGASALAPPGRPGRH